MRNKRLLILMCSLCIILGWCAPTTCAVPKQIDQPIAQQQGKNAHAVLRHVLARREFGQIPGLKINHTKKPLILRWLASTGKELTHFMQRIMKPVERFFHMLKKFFVRIAPKTPRHLPRFFSSLQSGLRYLLYAILGVAVLVLLGLLVSRLLLRRQHAQEDLEEMRDDPLLRRKQEPSFWEQSRSEAEKLWQAGNQREALRTLYRACLVLLDARGILRYDESRANGEVLRELRRQDHRTIHQSLIPIIRYFDRSWYGFLSLTDEEFTVVMENSQHFRQAVVEKHHA